MNDFATLRAFLTREVKNASYRRVAYWIGINHRTVWNIVNGKACNPSLETLEKIDRALQAARVVSWTMSAMNPENDCREHTKCGDECFGDLCPHYKEAINGK
jgi:hypothetical protein